MQIFYFFYHTHTTMHAVLSMRACMQGESGASMAQSGQGLTRDNALLFDVLPEVLGDSRSYSFNTAAWCYSEQDLEDIYCGPPVDDPFGLEG